MNTEDRIKNQRALIEEIGRYFDKEGFQPIAGRIMGLLMVMDKERFTFEEITEELGISKSSASNALRNLQIRNSIEYITVPGDRKRYFQLKIQDVFTIINEFEKKLSIFQVLIERIIELKADKQSRNAEIFKKGNELIEFFTENNAMLREKYKSK